MSDEDLLAETFEQHRARLRAAAHRMPGSEPGAEDAVQEAWRRLSRSGADDVASLAGRPAAVETGAVVEIELLAEPAILARLEPGAA